jgi:hypothetical protein
MKVVYRSYAYYANTTGLSHHYTRPWSRVCFHNSQNTPSHPEDGSHEIWSITTSLTAESITSLHPSTEHSNATRVKCYSEGGWLRMRWCKICDHVFTDESLANQPRAAAAFPYIRKLMTVDLVAKCPERGRTVLTTEILQCCGSYL